MDLTSAFVIIYVEKLKFKKLKKVIFWKNFFIIIAIIEF